MVDPIQSNLTGAISPATLSSNGSSSVTGNKFVDVLMESLEEVNRLQTEADESVEALYSGKTDDIASVFTAVNKAGVAFDLLMEIRNKLVDAYQEIQQIRV